MSSFLTYNQFDNKFKEYKNFHKNRSACPMFALYSAYNFMINGNISKEQHESNIDQAVNSYQNTNLPKYMSFGELIQLFNDTYTDKNIEATTPEIINEFGYGVFFKELDYKENYCTIILKNSNFFTIMVKNDNHKLYCIRDCHEKEQYNFTTLEQLKYHLRDKYQFEELTIVDGVLIEEYGNIEALVIDKKFNIIEFLPKSDNLIKNSIISDHNILTPDELLAMQLMMDNY